MPLFMFTIAPAVLGGLISAGGGVLSSIFGGASSSSNASKSIRFQRQENEKNRQWNLKLARMQNDWNMALYDKNNAYNSPSAQKQRYIDAGLNPDLMYSGNGSSVAAVAPQLTSGEGSHGSVSNPYAPYDASATTSMAFDNALKAAQVGLIRAQTKKTDAEGDVAISDAKFRDAVNSGALELQNANINFLGKKASLTDWEIKKMTPEINYLNSHIDSLKQSIDESKARVANVSADTFYKQIQNSFASEQIRSNIAYIKSQTGFNEAQIKRTLLLMSAEYAGLTAQAGEAISRMHLNNATIPGVHADNEFKLTRNTSARFQTGLEKLDFDVQNTKVFGVEIGTITRYLDCIHNIFNGINPVGDIKKDAIKTVGMIR